MYSFGDYVAVSTSRSHSHIHAGLEWENKVTHKSSGCIKTPADLFYPHGIVVDAQRRLFIADCHNRRVMVLSDEGDVLGYIGLTKRKLREPRGIAIDQEGNLIVTCRNNDGYSRVVKFAYNFE